jgi:nucleotide-binding universal stress UspA family protein
MTDLMVIGVDDSEAAAVAAAVGEQLAARLGLRVMLANVVDDGRSFPYGDAQRRERSRHASRSHSGRLLGSMGGPDAAVETLATRRPAAHALAELTAHEQAALLVVGTRGRGTLRSALSGSVSRTLQQRCSVPVLIVPPQARPELAADGRQAVVCGVDGTPSSAAAARAAAVLASALDVEMVLVHALRPLHASGTAGVVPVATGDEVMDAQAAAAWELLGDVAAALDPGLRVRTRVERGPVAEVLARVAAEERAVAIAVGSRGHGRVHAALVGSTCAGLIARSSCPVLATSRDACLQLPR